MKKKDTDKECARWGHMAILALISGRGKVKDANFNQLNRFLKAIHAKIRGEGKCSHKNKKPS